MTEKALYNALSTYNQNIRNVYSNNWGSLLNFMGKFLTDQSSPEDDTQILTSKVQRMIVENDSKGEKYLEDVDESAQLKKQNLGNGSKFGSKVVNFVKSQIKESPSKPNNINQEPRSFPVSARTSRRFDFKDRDLQAQTSRANIQQFQIDENSFVYRSFKKVLEVDSRFLKSNSQRNKKPPKPIAPTTLSTTFVSSNAVPKLKKPLYDPDPAIENSDLVKPNNTLQKAIQLHRKKVKNEGGNQSEQQSVKKLGDQDLGSDHVMKEILKKNKEYRTIHEETVEQRGKVQTKKLGSYQSVQELIQSCKRKTPEIDFPEENVLQIKTYPGNLTADEFLIHQDKKKWIRRNISTKELVDQEQSNRNIMQFAKDLFTSWDLSGNGSLSEDEVFRPLISLGLAPDQRFARKIWRALKPHTSSDEPAELVLEDFLRIFKPDKTSDRLMTIVSREIEKKNQKLKAEIFQKQQKHSQKSLGKLTQQSKQMTNCDSNLKLLKLDSQVSNNIKLLGLVRNRSVKETPRTQLDSVEIHKQLTTNQTSRPLDFGQKQSQQTHTDDYLVQDDLSEGNERQSSTQSNLRSSLMKARELKQCGLVEQTEQIKQLWINIAANEPYSKKFTELRYVTELPLKTILCWLVDEEVVVDPDKAKGVISTFIGKNLSKPGHIQTVEFMKLFQKGMFKQALLKLARTFDKQQSEGYITAGMSMGLKLDTFQRKSMIKGIDKNNETHKDIKKMLHSLKEITPECQQSTYQQMVDKLQKQAPQNEQQDEETVRINSEIEKYKFIASENQSESSKIPTKLQARLRLAFQSMQKVEERRTNLCLRRLQTIMKENSHDRIQKLIKDE